MVVDISRLIKLGNSFAMVIPYKMAQQLRWNIGDRIALRVAGQSLILERVPMEQLAKVRAGVVEGS